MNMRYITFSFATAVGICFATSQLIASEPAQPDGVTQDVRAVPTGGDVVAEELDVVPWMICEGWMPYEEIIANDLAAEQAVNEKATVDNVEPELADVSDEIVCADEPIEVDENSIAQESGSLESNETVSGEAEQVEADDLQASAEATAEDSEAAQEQHVANEELSGGSIWVAVFDAYMDESELAADGAIQQKVADEQPVKAIDGAEPDGSDEIVDSTVEESVLVESTDNVETDEVTVVPTIEELATNDDLAADVEATSEEVVDVAANTTEPAEASSEREVADASAVEEQVVVSDAVESGKDIETLEEVVQEQVAVEEPVDVGEAIGGEDSIETIETTEEATASDQVVETEEVADANNESELVPVAIEVKADVEETTAVTDEIAAPVAVEAFEEESLEQEAVEEAKDVVAAFEDLSIDRVPDDEELLEVAQPLVDEAELQEPVSESIPTTDVNEGEVGTVRTFEFGDCKITITSERQVDDFELLDMLWETVYQLEAEMD